MNIQELVGKRCLLKLPGYNSVVDEFRVLEIAPSGNWVKLLNHHGHKFWRAVTEVSFVEELRDLRAERAALP